MTPHAVGTGTLHARRIRQRVLVARGHPDPERVRRRMHDALASHLPDALALAFAPMDASHDDAVWRIRHLSLDVAVNAAWDGRALARAWAAQLALVVRRAMQTGGDGVSVMRFPSRAAHLASFVSEIAEGTAWTRWWFDSFDGLRLMSRSATIRTALAMDATLGAAALASLPAPQMALVAGSLSEADARQVLDVVSGTGDGDDAEGAARALLAAHRAIGSPTPRADEERWALRLVGECLRTSGRVPRPIAVLARAMARLPAVASEHGTRMRIVRRLLAEGNAASLRLVLAAADVERIAPLARLGSALADAIVTQLGEHASPQTPNVERAGSGSDWMPFGAPLLFAPILAALPLDIATRGWPAIGAGDGALPAGRASAESLVRLLAMATACGGERAMRVIDDPTSRMLAGVGSGVTIAQIHDWLEALGIAHAARLEFTIGAWRRSAGGIAADTWVAAETAAESEPRRTLALIDSTRGGWIALRDVSPQRSAMDDAVRSLGWWIAPRVDRAQPPRRLIAEEPLLAMFTAHGAASIELLARRRIVPDATNARASTDPLDATLARLDRLGDEITWLSLPASLGVPRALELALAVVAQGVLREIAWRLPGFARTSLPHLWTNFLAVDAEVVHEPSRIAARVGRPPLAMIIGRTGMMRSTFELPWCPGRRISLFPADDR